MASAVLGKPEPWRTAQRKILGSTRGSRVGFGGSPKRTFSIDNESSLGTTLRNGLDSSWRLHFHWGGLDHPARHVHVYDDDANFITRMNLETMQPMDVLKVDKRIVDLIRDLQSEGRL